MKIFNKFVESKKEPSNKNDIWFDGSVVRLYEAGEWYTVTLSKEALEKLVKYAENVKIFKYVDTLPEIGDPSLIYFQKELSDGGIILVPYVYDDEWKQITNSEVFTETSPFGFGDAENSAVLKGGNNKATNANEVALGEYNESNNDTRFSIGIGTSDTDRKNAVEVKQNGDVYITGIGGYNDNNFNKAKTLKSIIDNKIDKIEGKDLSSNDFTNALKEKLEGLENYDDAEISSAVEKLSRDFNALLGDNASAAIESFNEIIAFLEGIEDSASLDAIVASIQQEIAKVSNGLADTDAKLTNLSAETEAIRTEVESHNELIADLLDMKIDKEADDYYPQLAVGLADNLSGVDVVDSEVNFRRSGGGAISDGVARIEAIKGNSVVWNQLYSDTRFENGIGYWKPYGSTTVGLDADGSLLVTATSTSARSIYNGRYVIPANHKILTIVDFKPNNIGNGKFIFYMRGSSATETLRTFAYTETKRQIAYTIIEHDVNGYIVYYPIQNGEVGDSANIYSVVAYDLTQMFGAGNEPTTIEEFYARIPMGVDLNAYNEGEVIHMDVQSIESVGVNQWDEEWEVGGISGSNGTNISNNSLIRSKNYIPIIPNIKYYSTITFGQGVFFYNEKEEFIVRLYNLTAIPNNAKYMRFVAPTNYGTTYNHDICINLSDTSINGKYFPYIKRVEDLSIIRKYFPQGMKSAGTAHDEIRYNKVTQKWEYSKGRFKSVDLGTFNWRQATATDGFKYYYTSKGLSDAAYENKGNNILTPRYMPAKKGANEFADKDMRLFSDKLLYIRDDAYTDASTFKAAMQGVILYYESNDWEWVELDAEDQFKDLDYQVWNCGTEKAIAEGKSAPLAADITYGFNAIGKIKELESLVAALRAKVGI